jgi:hypothetical protein
MAINPQRIPMSELEEEAVNRLLAAEVNPQSIVSLARNEPGESGPVRVEVDGNVWLVDDTGHYRKERG